MKKAALLIREHLFCVAMVVLLLLINLIGWGSLLQYRSAHPEDVSLVGTFRTNNTADATYFAFDRDGEFYVWKQFQPIDRGSYQQNGEYVTLTGENGVSQLLIKGGCIYAYDSETNQISSYEKFENTPLFVNVTFE